MKKYIFVLSLLMFFKIDAQELSISETIDYINTKLRGGRKIELLEGGILKISDLRPDYFFTETGIDTRRNNNESGKYKLIPYKTDEGSIYEMNIVNKDFTENRYTYGKFLTEFKCKESKQGCIKTKFYGLKERIVKAEISNTIEVSNYERTTNDKLFNSLKYLISLARNEVKYQNHDSDPFASKNFEKIEIISDFENDNVKLSLENGVYKITVLFGTLTKDFILDSGASEISISENFEKELLDKGYLTKEDYIESGLYKIADGSIISCRRVKIKELKVGSFIIKNVNASISLGSAPLLLGKNFLDNFSRWSIDNNSKTLSLEK